MADRTNCPRTVDSAPIPARSYPTLRRPARTTRPSRWPPTALELTQVELDGGCELARERDADAAGEGRHPLADDRRHLVRVRCAVDIHLEVVDLAHRDVPPLARDGAIGIDRGDDRAPLARLAEVEWIGVARIGVQLGVARHVVMAEEGVREAGRRQLGGVERRVRRLARLLPRQGRALRRMGEGDVHAAAVDAEPLEQVVRVGRRAVRGPPQGQPVVELHRPELRLGEDVHVRRPLDQRVRAARREPVVVARRQVDAAVRPLERAAQEFDGIRTDAVLFEQVARAQDRVDRLGLGEGHDLGEGIAAVATTRASGLRRGPGERGVEVEVREMEQLHGIRVRVAERRAPECPAGTHDEARRSAPGGAGG